MNRIGRLVPALGLLMALAACGGPAPTPVPPSAVPSASPGATSGPSVSPLSSPSLVAGSASPVAADPGLFAFVGQGQGDGLTFQFDPDTTAAVAADPGLAHDAVGLAIGVYTVTGQQPIVDFAIVSVVHLRDPSAGEDWFRKWRDTYDKAACEQAGGVARHAETTIGSNQVFIGGCAGGAFTYHVRLPSRGIVVSITGVGPRQLGNRIAGSVGQ